MKWKLQVSEGTSHGRGSGVREGSLNSAALVCFGEGLGGDCELLREPGKWHCLAWVRWYRSTVTPLPP